MGNEPILRNNSPIGYVTSGDYGYTVNKNIAYGYLPMEHADPGTILTIQYLGKNLSALVAEEPLFDPQMERLKS
jgi:glycine cleavage system aminomethyltransferase T